MLQTKEKLRIKRALESEIKLPKISNRQAGK